MMCPMRGLGVASSSLALLVGCGVSTAQPPGRNLPLVVEFLACVAAIFRVFEFRAWDLNLGLHVSFLSFA